MDKILKLFLPFVLLTLTQIVSGQTLENPEAKEQIFNNICDCFENDHRELGKSFYSIEMNFDSDSVAYAEILWNASFTEQYQLPIDNGLLQVNNLEVEMSAMDISLLNDTILKVKYILPELEFSNRIQPLGLMIGPFQYRYNRLIVNSQNLRCGELFVQLSD